MKILDSHELLFITLIKLGYIQMIPIKKERMNSSSDIEDLVRQFISHSLPVEEWNHHAHILVAFWFNMKYDYSVAVRLVSACIKSYNLSVGTINSDNSGYHETLTIFWMGITRFYMIQHPVSSIADLINEFLGSKYAMKEFPFEYYSREYLFSVKARKEWVDGDLSQVSFLGDYNKSSIKPEGKEDHLSLNNNDFDAQFANCILPPELFTHEAHLRLAWIHLDRHGLDLAKENIPLLIQNYVAHLGAQDKYHHTLTVAAVEIVNHFMKISETNNFSDFIAEFPQLKFEFKLLIGCHYSYNIFDSKEAKLRYVEPDYSPF